MKKCLLSGAFLVLMAVAAQAQVTFQYNRQTSNSSLTITYSSGYYYGYGGGSSFGPGLVGNFGGGTFAFGVRHVFPSDFGYGGYAYGYGFPGTYVPGSYYAGGGLYSYGTPPGLYGGRGFVRRTPVSDYYPGPLRAGPVTERGSEFASAREIEEGKRRFRAADYRGAVDEFRAAVTAHTENPLAQAYFGLALAVAGDHKNADKALRGAAEHVGTGKIDFKAMFRDDKERSRVQGALSKAPDGSLGAAWALSLLGEPDRLKKLAEKDVAARNLSP